MSKQLGSIEVLCDSPPYEVVQTCRALGIRTPEDVRWLRLSTFRGQLLRRSSGVMSYLRGLFRTPRQDDGSACTCGRAIPLQDIVVITFDGSEQVAYQLGQCVRCRTVFWDLA